MSASTSTTPSANQFVLQDDSKTTSVIYQPRAAGPIIVGRTPGGAKVQYTGEEGSFDFTGDQVQTQASPIGTLVSVDLHPHFGASTTFTLVLPAVNQEQGTDRQSFHAIAIKAKHGLVETEGADVVYSTIELQGEAEIVVLPLTV